MTVRNWFFGVASLLIVATALLLASQHVHSSPGIFYKPAPLELNDNQVLNVYYFHGNVRCSTCKRIEKYTTQAIQQGYLKPLGQHTLQLKTVNVEAEGNGHYVEDFQLMTRSVVLELTEDGKTLSWQRLDRVWQLVNDEQKFTNYLYKEIERITQDKPSV